MATSTSHPEKTCFTFEDYTVQVFIDGKEVPHYGIEINEEKKEFSCWIPSEEGKPFSVKFRKRYPAPFDFRTTLYVDGQDVFAFGIFEGETCNKELTGARVSTTEIQKFVFASLELTDDDAYLNSSFTKTGDIEVELVRAKLTSVNHPPRIRNNISIADKVHERAKKGLNHHIKLGAKETVAQSTKSVNWIDLDTLATFVFKYRPLEMLQATGIAPRNPSSSPVEREDNPSHQTSSKRKHADVKQDDDVISIEDDSDEEERVLLERLEKVQRDKHSKKASGSGSNKRVKQEPKTYFTPGEVIDLT